MNNGNAMPHKTGSTIFRTPDYGGHMHNGPVRTFFRNEVRAAGTGYRVVEVMLRGRPGDEKTLCEHPDTVEYPSLIEAMEVAIRKRQEYLGTAAAENSYAAEAVTASDRQYMFGTDPSAAAGMLGTHESRVTVANRVVEMAAPGNGGSGEAFPVSIEVRPMLIGGAIARTKGRQHAYLMLDSEQPDREFVVSLWHETVHLLMLASGIPASEHDEEVIESMAQKLADCCPEIVGVCRLRQGNTDEVPK